MVNFRDLINDSVRDGEPWDDTKISMKSSIDRAIERGKVDKETLLIMKELLDISRPVTMKDYIEEDIEDDD